jgi:hypothetical protein
MAVFQVIQEFGNGFLQARMAEVRRNFVEGFQDKAPLMQERMGNRQVRQIDYQVVKKQQVKVNGSRSPFEKANSPESDLDCQHLA